MRDDGNEVGTLEPPVFLIECSALRREVLEDVESF